MRRTRTLRTACVVAVTALAAACGGPAAGAEAAVTAVAQAVEQSYDLGGPRTQEPQCFLMETVVVNHAEDGTRTSAQRFVLKLKYEPGVQGRPNLCTCVGLTYQVDDGEPIGIPALEGWSYPFSLAEGALAETGVDEKGQTLGISHERFEGLTDANGTVLPPQLAYVIYNNFIDFHAMTDLLARPMGDGGGIEDLRKIGDRVVHAGAHTEAPVNLGSHVGEGSFFRNGEMTLELKGLSAVDGAPCALVGYDSGASAFEMHITPMPNMKVLAVGSSHYRGDIYVDLATMWVRRVDLTEVVVARTTMGEQVLAKGVVDRTLIIRAVSPEELDQA